MCACHTTNAIMHHFTIEQIAPESSNHHMKKWGNSRVFLSFFPDVDSAPEEANATFAFFDPLLYPFGMDG